MRFGVPHLLRPLVLRCNAPDRTIQGDGCLIVQDFSGFFRSLTTVKSQVRDGLNRLRAMAPELATLKEVRS